MSDGTSPYSFRLNPKLIDEHEVKEYLDQWLAEDAKLPKDQQLGLRGIIVQVFNAYMTGVPKPPVGRQEYRLERTIAAHLDELDESMREYIEDLEQRLVQKLNNITVSSSSEQVQAPQTSELDDDFVNSLVQDFRKSRRKK